MQKFYSHGKLLITGEYVVLDGAAALALPTRFGQSMEVTGTTDPFVSWTAYDQEENIWFETRIASEEITGNVTRDIKADTTKDRLISALIEAHKANPQILSDGRGFKVITRTEFPLDWGLGTSSTLIANIAKWFSIDPFELLKKTFGGSGYDVAVAIENSPITYELTESGRSILTTSFQPSFKDHLFFVHLNRKQNSRESIAHYKKQEKEALLTACEKISRITHQVITCTSLAEFNLLLEIHENIISQLINLPKVKTDLFPDFPGGIKSLGGWGGDFILATGGEAEQDYFRKKGYATVIPYSKMIL